MRAVIENLCMLPLVLSHDLVLPFKFWYQNELCEGMCSGKKMYRLSRSYQAKHRQQAFGVAVALAQQGAQVCITCTRREYKVWVGLRTMQVTASVFVAEAIAP